MQTQDIDYRADAVNLRGYLAFDDSKAGRRPGVLVFHEGLGFGDFVMARARRLAEVGYVAFAADLFGDRRNAMRAAMYSAHADRRSWASMRGLFDEVL